MARKTKPQRQAEQAQQPSEADLDFAYGTHGGSVVGGPNDEPMGISITAVDDAPPTVDEKLAAAEAKTNGAPVERVGFSLRHLEDNGILVDFDRVSFNRLYAKLPWEVLGVELADTAAHQISSPTIRLLPARYCAPIEHAASVAQQSMWRYSFRFSAVAVILGPTAYRWVPWTAWEDFEAQIFKGRQMLAAAKLKAVNDYAAIVAEMTEMLRQEASKSRRRLAATKEAEVPPDFEDRMVAEGLKRMPSVEQIEAIDVRYRPAVLALDADVLAEQRRAIEERARLTEAELVEWQTNQAARAEQHKEQTRLWQEEQEAKAKVKATEAELAAEAAVKARLRQIKMEAAQEQIQASLSPMVEALDAVRATLYNEAVQLRKSLAKGKVPGVTAKRIRKVAIWFKSVNGALTDDAELDVLLTSLRELAGDVQAGARRDADAMRATLDEIAKLCKKAADEAQSTGRFEALEI